MRDLERRKAWDKTYREKHYKGPRPDLEHERQGRKQPVRSGVGSLTLETIRASLDKLTCGNCDKQGDLMWSHKCEQLLCGACRKKYIAATRALTAAQKFDRALWTTNMSVPGSYWPDELRSQR